MNPNRQCAPFLGTGSSVTSTLIRIRKGEATSGRLARFLMNTMLASGGYPWSIIRVENRDPYLAALERASVHQDIEPFARFVTDQVLWSMEQAT